MKESLKDIGLTSAMYIIILLFNSLVLYVSTMYILIELGLTSLYFKEALIITIGIHLNIGGYKISKYIYNYIKQFKYKYNE